MKRIIAIMLFLLTLVGCLFACGENITPATGNPDDVPATEEPEKVIIETKMGTMPLYFEEYWLMEQDELKAQHATGITEPIVRVFTSREEIKPLIHDSLWEISPDGEIREFESYVEYDDTFFETKKVVSITFYTAKRIEMTADYVYSQTDKDGATTYHAKVIVRDYSGFVGDGEYLLAYSETVTIAIDKNIDITPENLTVDLVDLRK